MLRVNNIRKRVLLSALVAIGLLGLGCGGGETPGFGADTENIRSRGAVLGGDAKPGFSGAGPAQRVEGEAPQAGEGDSRTTDAAADGFGDSGLVVNRINVVLKPGQAGGSLEVYVLNSGDTVCDEVTITVDLLRRNKSVVGTVDILGSGLAPGSETTFQGEFQGIGVSKAVGTGGSCKPAQ